MVWFAADAVCAAPTSEAVLSCCCGCCLCKNTSELYVYSLVLAGGLDSEETGKDVFVVCFLVVVWLCMCVVCVCAQWEFGRGLYPGHWPLGCIV